MLGAGTGVAACSASKARSSSLHAQGITQEQGALENSEGSQSTNPSVRSKTPTSGKESEDPVVVGGPKGGEAGGRTDLKHASGEGRAIGEHSKAPLPLFEGEREIFWSSLEDAPSEVFGGVTKAREGKHYVAGNEWGLHVFKQHIEDLGGGYIGVGSDQGYLLAGWMKADFAWFVDYDPAVVTIHDCYRAFFSHSESLEDFLALWEKDGRTRARAILDEFYSGDQRRRAREMYGQERGWIRQRLRRLARKYRRVPSFLSDEKEYAFVRESVMNGRFRSMQANLLKEGAIQNIAKSAKKLGVPIKVLYLSNAEEYWKQFPEVYRENIRSLAFAEDGVILRTLLTWSKNKDYRYNLQAAHHYIEWLALPWLRSIRQISPPPRESNAGGADASKTGNVQRYPFSVSERPRQGAEAGNRATPKP